MLVILSKEEEREEPLAYTLTDIKIDDDEMDNTTRKAFEFRFDDSEHQTFQKLKKIELMDYERIVETEGIPFSFIINLMTEI
jgi:hypothetical protein